VYVCVHVYEREAREYVCACVCIVFLGRLDRAILRVNTSLMRVNTSL